MSAPVPDWAQDLMAVGEPEQNSQPDPATEERAQSRSADSYSADELRRMSPGDREFIECTQKMNAFYRWLDAFKAAWGFPWGGPSYGMVQKLPHENLTATDLESLSKGGKSISELEAIAARARAARKEISNGN